MKYFRATMPCVGAMIQYVTKMRQETKFKQITADQRFDKIESVIARLEREGFEVFTTDPIPQKYSYRLNTEHAFWNDRTQRWEDREQVTVIYKEIHCHCIVIEGVPFGHTETLHCHRCGEKLLLEFPDSTPFNFERIKINFTQAHRFCVQAKRRSRGEII